MDTVQTIDSAQETLPQFPKLTGPLGDVVNAITNGSPYEHRALSLLTYVGLALSGRTRLAAPYTKLQPRFYTCLVGPVGSRKSGAYQAVAEALEGVGGVHVNESIDSRPGLVMALKALETADDPTGRLLFLPDEATGAFQKAQQRGIFDDFKHLADKNTLPHRVKDKETTVTDAHFAMVAGVTPEFFARLWRGGAAQSGGLPSRFVLSYSDDLPSLTWQRESTDELESSVEVLKLVLLSAPEEISLPDNFGDFTFGLVGEGSHIDRNRFPRVVDMERRFALILAACNGKTKIDAETMKAGAEFINYQIAIQTKLIPGDSWSARQDMGHRILDYFRRQDPNKPRKTRNDAVRNIKPERAEAGVDGFNKMFDALVKSGKLQSNEKNHKGFEQWIVDE
jgi:hypothetical protein